MSNQPNTEPTNRFNLHHDADYALARRSHAIKELLVAGLNSPTKKPKSHVSVMVLNDMG